jgi:hypothetical protein
MLIALAVETSPYRELNPSACPEVKAAGALRRISSVPIMPLSVLREKIRLLDMIKTLNKLVNKSTTVQVLIE